MHVSQDKILGEANACKYNIDNKNPMFMNPVCSKKNTLVVETRDHGTAGRQEVNWKNLSSLFYLFLSLGFSEDLPQVLASFMKPNHGCNRIKCATSNLSTPSSRDCEQQRCKAIPTPLIQHTPTDLARAPAYSLQCHWQLRNSSRFAIGVPQKSLFRRYLLFRNPQDHP